mmetsp:Transcript_11814/g.34592  ORF Transcript_11814/g.34592 Transcript_11814/m.34592 type:complete len:100 (+) Transcript_11814:859-1158(+)
MFRGCEFSVRHTGKERKKEETQLRVYAKPAPPGRKPSESLQVPILAEPARAPPRAAAGGEGTPLKKGWHATKTGDGRTYYYSDGGETSWERPGAEDLAV